MVGHITTRFLGELYAYEDDCCATADRIFAELDEKWGIVELAQAYARANEFPAPTLLGDYLAFARAFADELELRGWIYRNLVDTKPELSQTELAEYEEEVSYAWQDASEIRKYVMDCLLTGAHLSDMNFGELGHSIEVDREGEWVLKWGLEEDASEVTLLCGTRAMP